MSPRTFRLHPGSWWLVAIALIAVATSAGLPILLMQVLILCSLGLFIREGTTMANSARLYVLLALGVFAARLCFRLIFNYETPVAAADSQALFGLPRIEIELGFLGAIKLFGAMTMPSLTAAVTDALRLAAIILSAGLANTLAAPKRLIAAIPGSLFELAIALSIALNFAPAIISGFERVRRVQTLRGSAKKSQLIKRVLIPVLEDALGQSFNLAASMANRGFGRRHQLSASRKTVFRISSLFALFGFAASISLWITSDQTLIASIALICGVLGAISAIRIASPPRKRTRVHPQKFGLLDWSVAIGSLAIASAVTTGWL